MRRDVAFICSTELSRLVALGYSYAWVTVTQAERGAALKVGNRTFNKRISAANKRLVRSYGVSFFGAIGYQQRGAVHLHELVLFSPELNMSAPEIRAAVTKNFSGIGRLDCQVKRSGDITDADINIVSYYVAKNYVELPEWNPVDRELINSLSGETVMVRARLGHLGKRLLRSRSWRETLEGQRQKRIRYVRWRRALAQKLIPLVYVIGIRNIDIYLGTYSQCFFFHHLRRSRSPPLSRLVLSTISVLSRDSRLLEVELS